MKLVFNRVKISRSSTSKLSVLKRKTGLTPNLLCRIGLCLSLDASGTPHMEPEEDGMEFNRYTLTGEWDQLFLILLKQRLDEEGLDFERAGLDQLKAHLSRGITMVHSRVKSLPDLQRMLPESESVNSNED